MSKEMLNSYLVERDQLLATITGSISEDPHIKAAWLIGSLGRGNGDALSDIDLWLVVDDQYIQIINRDPQKYAAQIRQPVFCVEAPQNAPDGGAYLMTCYDAPVAPHIVDWYWQPQSKAYITDQVRILFDRVSLKRADQPIRFARREGRAKALESPFTTICYFWMMLMITAKSAVRAPWAEKLELLPLLMEPLRKVQNFLEQPDRSVAEEIPPHAQASQKFTLLCKLSNQMNEMMIALSRQGEDVPLSIVPVIDRYLEMTEANI